MAHCKNVDEFERILECPICLQRIKDPRILSCLHSFCFKCIAQHVEEKQTNGSFPCPMCNIKFPVPPGGATEFRRNLYLVDIGELFPESSYLKCAMCALKGSESAADSICIQCREHLCNPCREVHCSTTSTFDHAVVSLEEVRNGEHVDELRQFKKFHCFKHPQKLLEIYCKDCMEPLCLLCAMLEHKQHEMNNIEAAASDVGDDIRALLDPWEKTFDHFDILAGKLEGILENLDQQEEQLVDEVERLYDKFKNEFSREIDLKKNGSVRSLKAEIANARKQSEIEFNEAEFSRTSTSGTLKYAKGILDSGHDVEKLQQFQYIKTRLSNLDIREVETGVTMPIFSVQPENFKVPAFGIKTVRTTVTLGHPPMKDVVARPRCLSIRAPRERENNCRGLALNGNCFIITDNKNETVKRIDGSSGEVALEALELHHKLRKPRDVACNSKGDIFVTDDDIKGVVKYNEKDEVTKVSAPNMYRNYGYLTCCGNQLFLSDYLGGYVHVMDFEFKACKLISGASLGLRTFRPDYLCVDNEGRLVVSDYGQGRVHVIDHKQSTIIQTFSDEIGDCPRGVCVDKWGHLFVADCDNNRVVLIPDQCKECTRQPDTEMENIEESAVEKSNKARVLISSSHVTRPISLTIAGPGEIAVLEQLSGKLKIFKYMMN